jgi:hypothetical protein
MICSAANHLVLVDGSGGDDSGKAAINEIFEVALDPSSIFVQKLYQFTPEVVYITPFFAVVNIDCL